MTDDELKRLFESTRQESRSDFQEIADRLAAENRQQVELVRTDFREIAGGVAAENRQQLEIARVDFKEIADRIAAETRQQVEVAIEHFDGRFELLAEAIATVDEKLERKTSSLEDEMHRGFAETQAMMKFSHAELDRRVRALEQSHETLEEKLSDLQVRVDRLEGSTH